MFTFLYLLISFKRQLNVAMLLITFASISKAMNSNVMEIGSNTKFNSLWTDTQLATLKETLLKADRIKQLPSELRNILFRVVIGGNTTFSAERKDISKPSKALRMHKAAANGQLTEIENLVKAGKNIKATTTNNDTPLHYAAYHGRREVVRYLLSQGADSNAHNKNKQTPLHCAAENGYLEIATLLVDYNALIDKKDINDCTPLHYAACNGNQDVVKFLLEKGAHRNALNKNKQTPLQCAAKMGNNAVFELLVTDDTINIRDRHNATALFIAANMGNYKIVERLLHSTKTDVNLPGLGGLTPLHVATLRGYESIITLLVGSKTVNINAQDINKRTPLLCAAESGQNTVVTLLLHSKKIKVNRATKNRETPLHIATQKGYIDVIQQLLQVKGCKKGVVPSGGHYAFKSALWVACKKGYSEIAKLLLKKEAKVDTPPTHGEDKDKTALWIASKKGYIEIVKLLLKKGAKVDTAPNQGEDRGKNALWVAYENGHTAVCKLLLSAGASIQRAPFEHSESDKTLLWVVAEQGNAEFALEFLECVDPSQRRALLQRSAKLENSCGNSVSPLWIAACNGHSEICSLLLNAGSQVNEKVEQAPTDPRDVDDCDLNEEDEDNDYSGSMSETDYVDNYHYDSESTCYRNDDDDDADYRVGHYSPDHSSDDEGSHNNEDNYASHKNERKHDPTADDCYCGTTPLWIAIKNRHTHIARLLLIAGADPNKVPTESSESDISPLWMASEQGDRELVTKLLKCAIDVEQSPSADDHSYKGTTPLWIASCNGYLEIVRQLINKGANLNAASQSQNEAGITPLMIAIQYNHDDVVHELLSHGAEVNTCCKRGHSPLTSAINRIPLNFNLNFKLIQTLLDRGAHVNPYKGYAPLDVAVSRGAPLKLVKILVDRGAHINETDIKGRTALWIAAKNGDKDIVKFLLTKGARKDMVPVEGKHEGLTPLEIAKEMLPSTHDVIFLLERR